jgi:hypothetical protein
MSEIQCFKNHCPEIKKREEIHKASVSEERKSSRKTKQDETNFFF